MNTLLPRVPALAAALLFAICRTALPSTFPIAPPGSNVILDSLDFIQSVPEQSPGLLTPNPVIGANLTQHPGAFRIGFPEVGTFFVGVFADLIDTTNPSSALYLWETTGAPDNTEPFPGPEIQIGFWDGNSFTPYGIPQLASYRGTGEYWFDQGTFFEITSSVTPLSDFGIAPGFPVALNAVRIEAVNAAHNQVTAVAADIVPESSTPLLIGIGLAVLVALDRRKRNACR